MAVARILIILHLVLGNNRLVLQHSWEEYKNAQNGLSCRMRELASAARVSQDVGSCNPEIAFVRDRTLYISHFQGQNC